MLDEACMVLPRPLQTIRDLEVAVLAASPPDNVSILAINQIESIAVTRREEVFAILILVDRIEMAIKCKSDAREER